MTTPRVRTEGPPGQARTRRPSPPEVPAEYALTTEFRAKYQGRTVAFEIYGRRRTAEAYIRLIDAAGSMDAGKVTRGGTAKALVSWTRDACEDYDGDWRTEQADIITERIAQRWRAS